MRLVAMVTTLALSSTSSFAQIVDRPRVPIAPQHATATQILSSQLGQCAGQNAQLVEQNGSLQEQLTAAQARIKELEEKAKVP